MSSALAQAAELRVAVAANFAPTLKALAPDFEARTGHRLMLSAAATGKLYAQIKNGAPFDVLLGADTQTPERLVHEGAAVASSRLTYAQGRLVLWSTQANYVDAQGRVLKDGRFKHVALANPKLAPYGAAALQTLTHLGLASQLATRLVQGESVAQAFEFVASGNAELGFVALAQVWANGRQGSTWIVPTAYYSPLRQDAVLLTRAHQPEAARALLAYLQDTHARTVIRSHGYAID